MFSSMLLIGGDRAVSDSDASLSIDWASLILRRRKVLLRVAREDPRIAVFSVRALPGWSWSEVIKNHGLLATLSEYPSRFFQLASGLLCHRFFIGLRATIRGILATGLGLLNNSWQCLYRGFSTTKRLILTHC
ncbi:hypothetical protein [uncultured Thiodictyon sp.]|uniref:hypothetical protein n=1 Tax=uncultured Thiodictyon sp. TaxID=1846217 RepID=UPI0025DD9863|nr:hypothetical protein [uncultured Thiodictyon sp.]